MSSSAIGFTTLTLGPSGPIGPAGNAGPQGPAGVSAGIRGVTGPIAPNIQNIIFDSSGALVQFTDGTNLSANGSFLGPTLTGYSTVKVIDYLDDSVDSITYSPLSSGNLTNSFIMRGISASGSLVITEDSQAIYIDSIYTPGSGAVQGQFLTDNTLIYLKNPTTAASTTVGTTYNSYYDGTLNFEKNASTLSFSKLLAKSKLKYIAPTYKTSNSIPVKLNVNDAGVFYIRTPNGISEFVGDFKQNEITSFTLITQSDDIWNFPPNVYFENGENYLTCGKSIINLTSFDQGTSWYAVVAGRGFDGSTFNCEINSLVGSCCYQDTDGRKCKDFSNRAECNALSGTFFPLRSCSQTCSTQTGACCSNGKCLQDKSFIECLAFGGKYFPGIQCNQYPESGSNETQFCYNPCDQKVACCKDGKCLGDQYSVLQCSVAGGIPHYGFECSEIDCCENSVSGGACCLPNQTCISLTLNGCKALNGVFMGQGQVCGSVNCKCIEPTTQIYGSCCTCVAGVTQCNIVSSTNCTNGTFSAIQGAQPGQQCPQGGLAACNSLPPNVLNCNFGRCCRCIPGEVGSIECSSTTRTQCENISGTFTPGVDCSTPCSPCSSAGCDCPEPGIKCQCQDGVKICQTTDNIGSDADCSSGEWTCSNQSTTCTSSPCNSVIPGCSAVSGIKCECVAGVRTCTNIPNILNDPYCQKNPTLCSAGSCSDTACDASLPNCSQPDAKCKCIESPSGVFTRTCTQTLISGDPECAQLGGSFICLQNQTCGPNTCDTVLSTCVNTSCPAGQSESEGCPGISDIQLAPCTGCTDGFNEIQSRGNTLASKYTAKSNYNFSSAQSVDARCSSGLSKKYSVSGAKPLDIYIPLTSANYSSDGKDAKICIDIKIKKKQFTDGTIPEQKNSFRVYVLRTWYPKYFSTNYAAMFGYTYADGNVLNETGVVQYRNPSSAGSEQSIWPHLHYIRNVTTNSGGSQLVPSLIYSRNLSTFTTIDGYDHIPTGDDTININTVRLIEELNCPLLGYNPRGLELEHENNTGSVDSQFPSTGNISPSTQLNPDITIKYALGASYEHNGYYSTVNILGTYLSYSEISPTTTAFNSPISSTTSIDRIKYVNNTNSDPTYSTSAYYSRSRMLSPGYDVVNGVAVNNSERVRSFGYTDFGYCTICNGESKKKYYDSRSPNPNDENDAIGVIGYYAENATLNRFANVFQNNRLIQRVDPDDDTSDITGISGQLLPPDDFWHGHPYTVDHEANFTLATVNSTTPGGSPSQVLSIEYDPSNSNSGKSNNGSGFTNSYITNNGNGINITKSPVYKTRPISIICDTGPMDQDGYYYPDYNTPIEHNVRQDRRKRRVFGAVNNPWYNSDSGKQEEPRGASRAETVITYTPDGMKLCIKLNNIADYVFRSNSAVVGTEDEYNYIKQPASQNNRNRRFRRYQDRIRLVIFPDAVNSHADQLQFPPDGSTDPFTNYIDSAEKYMQDVLNPAQGQSSGEDGTIFTVSYGCLDKNCCNTGVGNCNGGLPPGECDACNITLSDKKSNMYGMYGVTEFLCALDPNSTTRERCSRCGSSCGGYKRVSVRCCNIWGTVLCSPNCCGVCFTTLVSSGKCGPQNRTCLSQIGVISSSVLANCRNCDHANPCTGREILNGSNNSSSGTFTKPCGNLPSCDACPDGDPGGGGGGDSVPFFPCHTPILNKSDFNKARKKIRKFMDELGYVEGRIGQCAPGDSECGDYWFLQENGALPIPESETGESISNPIILFKLQPKLLQLPNIDVDGLSVPQELYSLDPVAPIRWIHGPESTSRYYFRQAICQGGSPSSDLDVGLRQYAFDPHQAMFPQLASGNYTVLQKKFCSLINVVPTKFIIDNISTNLQITEPVSNWITEIYEHGVIPMNVDQDNPDHPNHKYISHGAICPNGTNGLRFTSSTLNKKLFLNETEFICVAMDCLSVDCTQYQDCTP